MFQFKRLLHPLLFAAVFLCSCSQTDDITANDSKGEETSGDLNVVFRLQSNTSNVTRSVEDSYNHVQGTADEYKVNSVRVYFFENTTKLFAKQRQHHLRDRSHHSASGNIRHLRDGQHQPAHQEGKGGSVLSRH